jgi:sugar lactone lactonase YvrE
MHSKHFNFVRASVIASAVVLLAACGGGGGGGGGGGLGVLPIVPPAQPQGESQPPAVVNYMIGGIVTGLSGTLVLQNNAGDDLKLAADGKFSFASSIAKDSAYDIKVVKQPLWQFCTVTQGSGTVTAEVTDVAVFCSAAAAQVSTLAGSGASGSTDGKGAAASFKGLSGIALDDTGTVFVTQNVSSALRKIASDGDVVTLFGANTFLAVDGIARAPSGDLYVAEIGGNRIQRITPAGNVSVIAGSGVSGGADGNGIAAEFREPSAVAVDGAGNIYVADRCTIRTINSTGDVKTLAGVSGTCGFADGVGAAALFDHPSGIAVDAAGDLFVADSVNRRIRMVTPDGVVKTFAGSGSAGTLDGVSVAASFMQPRGIAIDLDGSLYVTDVAAGLLRRITATGLVSTLAGQPNAPVAQDGIGAAATFVGPAGIAVSADGTLYLVGTSDNLVRKVTPIQAP